MTARYNFVRRSPSKLKEGQEEYFYPRIVKSKRVPFTKIYERVADTSTMSTADCAGVMEMMKLYLIDYLREGNRVYWEGIGTFYVTLTSRPVKDPNEIRAESINPSRIAFIPDKKLKEAIIGMPLESSGQSQKIWNLTRQQKWENLDWYLGQHGQIRSKEYMSLNNVSRKTAQSDLVTFWEEGRLTRIGGKNISVFIRNVNWTPEEQTE